MELTHGQHLEESLPYISAHSEGHKCETMGCILDSLHKPQEERELLNFTSSFKPRMGFLPLYSTKLSMQRTFLCSACPVNGFTDS